MAHISIYLTNLGKYNEGELVGEWVELPVSDEELQNVFQRIGIDGQYYEEYFITDYETDIPGLSIDEYENISYLNEKAEKLSDLSDTDLKIFSNAEEAEFVDLEDIDDFDSSRFIMYWDVDTLQDLGYAMVDMYGGLEALGAETLRDYFDFEAYGRDIRLTWNAEEWEAEDPDISAYDYFGVSTDQELGEYYAYEFDSDLFSDNSSSLSDKKVLDFLENYFDYEAYARNFDTAGTGTFTSDGYIEDTQR